MHKTQIAHSIATIRLACRYDAVEKLVYIRTNNMQFMRKDAKQSGEAQLTTCYDEDDYMDIESADGYCQSSIFES
jgi:hypothetical protein